MKDQLGHGPVEVTIVGDLTLDQAIAQVGKTLGALPRLPSEIPAPGADQLRFPAKDLRRTYTHDGRADQNLSVIAWPTTDAYADPRRTSVLELLAAIMTTRELEDIREKQGATYSVSTSSNMPSYFPNFGFLISAASVRPEMDDAFYKSVSSIVDDLKQRPVTSDELTRARQPMIDHLHNEKNTNGYWMSLLTGSVRVTCSPFSGR